MVEISNNTITITIILFKLFHLNLVAEQGARDELGVSVADVKFLEESTTTTATNLN